MYSKIHIGNIKHITDEINNISGDIQSLSLDISQISGELRKNSIFYSSIRKLNELEYEILDEAYILHNLYVALDEINSIYYITEYNIIGDIN